MKKIIALVMLCMWAFAYAKPLVTVSIPPQKFFVHKIAGDSLDINVLLPKNVDEHNFEFKPNVMKELEKSDIYFTIGLEFEKVWIPRFKQNYKNLLIVETQSNITLAESEHHHDHEHHDHEHDHHAHHEHDHDHHDHDHDSKDPHIWLDPILVKQQAQNIAHALMDKYPEHKNLYQKNLESFQKELDMLDTKIQEKLKGIKNNKFIVYHPSWGYFAKRYGLIQIPIELEGKEPKLKDLTKIIDEAKKNNIKIIFVQPGFSQKSAEAIAKECGAKVVQIDHLSDEWESELLKSVENIHLSLQ